MELCWRRYDVIFGIVLDYFVFYEAYFVAGEFL
jgi:hypothetical protein